MTSNESNEVYSAAGMLHNNTSKEMTSNGSNKVCSDAGMMDNCTPKEMTLTGSNEVCSDVCSMIDNDTSGESPFENMGKHMGIYWHTSLPSKIILNIRESCEDLEEYELYSSPSGRHENVHDGGQAEINTRALETEVILSQNTKMHDNNEWTFKVLNVQSSDLKVVAGENFDKDGMTTGDGHQEDTCVQNASSGTTVAGEITPADSDESQQELDVRLSCESSHLKYHQSIHGEVKCHQDDTHAQNGSNDTAAAEETTPEDSDEIQHELDERPSCERTYHQRIHAEVECHQDDTRAQNGSNDVTADEETTPADSDENQQELDEHSCELCCLHVETTSEYYEHLKTHCNEQSWKCPVCGKVFVDKIHLFSHLQNHAYRKSSERMSTSCNKNKNTCKGNVDQHERIHTGVQQNKCTYCNKVFTQQGHLKEHERIHSGVKPYKCTYCNKAFTVQAHLKEHERIHTGVKPYQCTYCNKAFTKRCNLKRHERIHTGVKPYRCTYCKKLFKHRGSLKKHEYIHTGLKPYKCTYCNKAFTERGSRNKHHCIHTGVKQYKCTYCNKAFRQQGHLKEHERIHTGVKPYKCTYCIKAFTKRGNLKRHESTHASRLKPRKCT